MKLDKFFKSTGITRGKLAAHVGVTATTMGYYASGKCEPSLTTALAIEEATAGLVTVADMAHKKHRVASIFEYGKYMMEQKKLPPDLRDDDPWMDGSALMNRDEDDI